MPRYKLTIEYNGMPYRGWQKQEGLPTVQEAIEKAMTQFSQHEISIFGAGRTDAGVHARGQVIHVDFEKVWKTDKIQEATNGLLKLEGHPISVLKVEEAADDFDARFSAKYRSYKYRIINRRAPLTVDLERALWIRFPLNVDAMHEAAQELVGEHDFTIDVNRISETEIEIIAEARAFLHNQIRSFAGTLRLIGDGKWSKQDLVDALHAKDRTRCGPVAVPYGLYFMKVGY